ncbi:hypothetical protein Fcan01_27365 [Folsomia candida]|uniref:Tc1-like transposase DDE domain-containing protein n=1 Tax=Folsomia candida TaxID=158441 RepID=A0A226CY92_FOLCA|nr:hypothetical protein Fcan01_27365 [Folsomia candida]
MLRSKIKEQNIGPPSFSRDTLWRLLRNMGYKFTAIDRRIHLIEQPNIRLWRQKYIQRLNQNSTSDNPRPVIYLDESWIGCNSVAVKGWMPKIMRTKRMKLDHSFPQKTGRGPRLIMLHAGSKDGFVPGALLLKSSTTKDEDYHSEMDSFGFDNWFRKCLLPNIPPSSIIVMDNASYHSTTDAPKSGDKIGVMKSWLKKKQIPFDQKMIKKEIWKLVMAEKKNAEHLFIDRLAKTHGHEVLRLPPYQCDLNPIELVWGHIKQHVAKYNTTGKINDIIELAQEYIEAYDPDVWKKNVVHVEKIANNYEILDGFPTLPPEPFQIVIPLDVDDTDSETDVSDSDDDSDQNEISDDQDENDPIEQLNNLTDETHQLIHETPTQSSKRRKQALAPRVLF